MRANKIFTLLFSCVLLNTSFAQKDKNIWYFGGGSAQGPASASGIDFNTSPPTLLTTTGMYANEGSAVMSDKTTGALLFYTNGVTIYNKNHLPMVNGTGLNGNTSATQSSMIIPVPCSTTQYYVFVMYSQAIFNGLSYSIVDMTLNGGLGGVTTKNTSVSGQFVTEKLTAIKHQNGQDYWLIYHSFPNCPPFNPQAGSSMFYVRLITSAGVGPATTYNAGTAYIDLGSNPSNPATLGYLRPSHDCKMLAAAIQSQNVIDILNFDIATGAITSKYSFAPGHTGGYGVEFSPDNSKLYFSTGNSATANTGVLAQFDLSSGVAATVAASKQTIFSYTSPADGGGGSLLLAPDGKIYFARTANPGLNYLGVINSPNTAGTGCNFVQQGFMLGAKFSSLGLPNFLQEGCSGAVGGNLTVASAGTVCSGQPMTLTASGGTNYTWSTGSTSNPIIVSPSVTTTYSVSSTVVLCGNPTTTTAIVTVPAANINPVVSASSTICAGGVVTLTASGGTAYSWSNGATTSATSVSPATTTVYSVTVSSGNCSGVATTTVTVSSALAPVITGNTTICPGGTATLNASGGTTYSWSNGASTSSITVSPSTTTTYSVLASAGGCSGTATGTITVSAAGVPFITGNTLICAGNISTLTASGGASYLWSNGATTASITASPATTTTYSVTVSGACGGTASTTVTVTNAVIAAIVCQDVCQGDSATLIATGGVGYLWSNGAVTSAITVSPAATASYSVIVSAGSCADTTSCTVYVFPAPIISATSDTTIETGGTATLTATGGGTYLWSDGSTGAIITVSPLVTTQYSVTVTDSNGCTAVAIVTVLIDDPCSISAAGELYVPNAFSPNNDDENDVLEIYYGNFKCLESLTFTIYDRWGEKVFAAEGKPALAGGTFSWNGTCKGKPVNPAVYAYYLDATLITGEKVFKKGNVSLMK